MSLKLIGNITIFLSNNYVSLKKKYNTMNITTFIFQQLPFADCFFLHFRPVFSENEALFTSFFALENHVP